MAMSACALHPVGLFGQADAHYRSGLKELVADPPDYDQALSHLRKAAIRNHADAQKQLGRLYTGWGPEPDLVRGYLWLFLASRSDPDAENELIYLTRVMTREQVGRARALATGFVPGQAPDEPPEADSPDGTAEEQAARPEPNAGA